MRRRLFFAFALFSAAMLVASTGYPDSGVGLILLSAMVIAPLWLGWRTRSLLELALLWPCAVAAYLVFLAWSRQLDLIAEPKAGRLLRFNGIVIPLFAVFIAALGGTARWLWTRLRASSA